MNRDEERHRATGRDAAGIGPHLQEGMRLVPLKELDDIRLADGEPDIRGWEVQTVSGRKIGEVDDVLVDERTGEVALLDVDLDGTRKRTLAPARAVQLLRDRRVVLIDSTELRDAEQLPTLARTGEVTADELRLFRDNYAQLYGARAFHDNRDYEIQRRDQAVRLARHDAADTVASERVAAIDADQARRDAQTQAQAVRADAAARRDVHFPKGSEEVVVERRPVVMEEVVVRRRVVGPNDSTDAIDAARIAERGSGTTDARDLDHDGEVERHERALTDAERRARELRDEAR